MHFGLFILVILFPALSWGSLVSMEITNEPIIYSDPFEGVVPEEKPWVARGNNERIVNARCHEFHLKKALREAVDISEQKAAIQEFYKNCDKQYSNGTSLSSLTKEMSIDYNISSNAKIKKIEIKLPNGRKLKGLLGLKGDLKSRPLVIAKCGIYCDSNNNFSHRVFLMHLFDESPFNILSLGSTTGDDYILQNKVMAFGGIEEGREIYQIADYIKSGASPISHLVSSLHIVGVSLGGHGALYSGVYASHNNRQAIDSIMAFCPVIDLQSSMKAIFSGGIMGMFFNQITSKKRDKYEKSIELFKKHSSENNYEAVVKVALDFYKDLGPSHWDIAPFKNLSIENRNDLWSFNNLINYYNDIEIPTLALASKDDPIVKYKQNLAVLEKELGLVANDHLQVLALENGSHCANNANYGWSINSLMLREFILKHSPELRREKNKIDIEALLAGQASWEKMKSKKKDVTAEIYWNYKKGNSRAELIIKRYRMGQRVTDGLRSLSCSSRNFKKAPPACYKSYKFQLDLNKISLDEEVTEDGALRLTRWLNTRVRVLGEEEALTIEKSQLPKYLLYDSYN